MELPKETTLQEDIQHLRILCACLEYGDKEIEKFSIEMISMDSYLLELERNVAAFRRKYVKEVL